MKHIYISLFSFLVAGLLFTSCDEEGMNSLGSINPEMVEFSLEGFDVKGEIDVLNATVSLSVPPYADITSLTPFVEGSYGSEISPANGTIVDFSSPVTYTLENSGQSKQFIVSVEYGAMDTKSTRLLVLGTSSAISEITNEDELAAAQWGKSTFPNITYMSFDQLANDASILNETDVVWWHYDTEVSLPGSALKQEVLTALVNYRNNGGGLYLSGFATQYLEEIEVVQQGHGITEAGGAPIEFENPDNWGMSFRGHTDHPIFQGLRMETIESAFLISGGAWRKDNKAWWTVWDENTIFPDYGISLASTEWDFDRTVLVLMAEFPGTPQQGTVIAFSAGAYDWKSVDGENTFMDNVQRVTQNILTYVATETNNNRTN
ncbi:DUF4960 domain-containing protein [Labilibaculum sp. DW002]|uniref:DUF4960 domain-containing protein n=1 Tax=Paralabilibaculum antarcticum TaxID=2912572 RepID=A0ABT5VRP3_9BACT|nr:DUF4960 domain-containing protein [Labilibaculum sp. DW002]MDE5418098.1 DUF4960 domain-containing protein [Labilibaculum sp. DW002]